MSHEGTFREVQRFRQRWLWAVVVGGGLVSAVTGGPVGVLVAAVLVAFVWSLRLVTEVRDDGLYVRFAPFHRSFRRVAWSEVESVESTRYRPLREYGGWGIRWRPGTVAFSVSGSRGVLVERPDDRDLLVGSQRPDELATAIRERWQGADR